MRLTQLTFRLGLTLLVFIIAGCKRDNQCDVPSYPVYFEMNIVSMYPHFVPDNGFQILTFTHKRYERDLIGYAGLLVEVGMDGHYHAFDLCCPHCLDPKQPVQIDGFYAVCPTCQEAFDLSYGLAYPTKGVTRQALRRFGTIYQYGILTIRN
ncbi:MAG: hypothetical protein IJS00_00530 [Paludibacteraceae bacterium]|nr:hypothetical protein [Paludibacteraceae bacterium]